MKFHLKCSVKGQNFLRKCIFWVSIGYQKEKYEQEVFQMIGKCLKVVILKEKCKTWSKKKFLINKNRDFPCLFSKLPTVNHPMFMFLDSLHNYISLYIERRHLVSHLYPLWDTCIRFEFNLYHVYIYCYYRLKC